MPQRGEQFGLYEVWKPGNIAALRATVAEHLGQFLPLLVVPIDQERDMDPMPICVRLEGDLAPQHHAVPLTIFEGKMARLADESDPSQGYVETDERVVLDTVGLSSNGRALLMRPTSEPTLWLVPAGGQPDAPNAV